MVMLPVWAGHCDGRAIAIIMSYGVALSSFQVASIPRGGGKEDGNTVLAMPRRSRDRHCVG